MGDICKTKRIFVDNCTKLFVFEYQGGTSPYKVKFFHKINIIKINKYVLKNTITLKEQYKELSQIQPLILLIKLNKNINILNEYKK